MQFAAKFERTSASKAGSKINKIYTTIEGTPTLCLLIPGMHLELDQDGDSFARFTGYYGRLPIIDGNNMVPEFYGKALGRDMPVICTDPSTLVVGDLALKIIEISSVGIYKHLLEELISDMLVNYEESYSKFFLPPRYSKEGEYVLIKAKEENGQLVKDPRKKHVNYPFLCDKVRYGYDIYNLLAEYDKKTDSYHLLISVLYSGDIEPKINSVLQSIRDGVYPKLRKNYEEAASKHVIEEMKVRTNKNMAELRFRVNPEIMITGTRRYLEAAFLNCCLRPTFLAVGYKKK